MFSKNFSRKMIPFATQLSATPPAKQRFFWPVTSRSEEHTSELQSLRHLVCRLLLEKRHGISLIPASHDPRATPAPSIPGGGEARRRRRNSSPPPRSWSARRATLEFLFFNDTATTEIYTLFLHDALPISVSGDVSRAIARSGADLPGLDLT